MPYCHCCLFIPAPLFFQNSKSSSLRQHEIGTVVARFSAPYSNNTPAKCLKFCISFSRSVANRKLHSRTHGATLQGIQLQHIPYFHGFLSIPAPLFFQNSKSSSVRQLHELRACFSTFRTFLEYSSKMRQILRKLLAVTFKDETSVQDTRCNIARDTVAP